MLQNQTIAFFSRKH